MGLGGGSSVLFAEKDQTKVGSFKLLYPGLFVYHSATAPISKGMYGLVLVEPVDGLPKVDKEYYIIQSEFYTKPSSDDSKILEHSDSNDNPQYVFFNGREDALIDTPLIANLDETIRIYFGNAGPSLTSAFHITGAIFDKVYRDSDLISPPGRGLAICLVPPGGTIIVELKAYVPGTFNIVDNAIWGFNKGCIGQLKIVGKERPEIYADNTSTTKE